MLNNIYREKLLNAILFFAKKVKHPTKVKIFKLLFFLDFIHFKQTGKSVTNLNYFAWKFGPVPKDLWEEIKSGKAPSDFQKDLAICPFETESDKQGFEFKAKRKADLSIFTPREKKLLEDLVLAFKNVTPTQMSEISHLKNAPWDKTIKQKGEWAPIDYLLALDNDALVSEDEARELQKERDEMLSNYPLKAILNK